MTPRSEMHPASYVFGSDGIINQTGGWNTGLSFLFGLLSVQWTVSVPITSSDLRVYFSPACSPRARSVPRLAVDVRAGWGTPRLSSGCGSRFGEAAPLAATAHWARESGAPGTWRVSAHAPNRGLNSASSSVGGPLIAPALAAQDSAARASCVWTVRHAYVAGGNCNLSM